MEIREALNGFSFDYFYTGKKEGKDDLITLNVVTWIKDWHENLFIRECDYSGRKEKWKEVIKNQLIQQLKDIGVEEGFVKSETRYIEVSKDNYLTVKKYPNNLLDVMARIKEA